MRTNAKKDMILGESILENTPFNGVIQNSGLEEIVNSLSK